MVRTMLLRTMIAVIILTGLATGAAACTARTTVELAYADIAAVVGEGSLSITNTSNEAWTNVRLTLDQEFTDTVEKIGAGQAVTLPAANFISNGESIDPSLIGHGLSMQLTCDLPGNREGTFWTVWH